MAEITTPIHIHIGYIARALATHDATARSRGFAMYVVSCHESSVTHEQQQALACPAWLLAVKEHDKCRQALHSCCNQCSALGAVL